MCNHCTYAYCLECEREFCVRCEVYCCRPSSTIMLFNVRGFYPPLVFIACAGVHIPNFTLGIIAGLSAIVFAKRFVRHFKRGVMEVMFHSPLHQIKRFVNTNVHNLNQPSPTL